MGFIMDLLTRGFAGMLNTIFESVYSMSPELSLGIAIILFTILIKLLLLPLSIKQYISTKKMQLIQPELKKLQSKYKDKKDMESQQAMSKEMNELYQKHGTSPFGGCLPALIQLPIILALFGVLRKATLYITKLSDIYSSLATKVMEIANHKDMLGEFVNLKNLRIDNLDTVENIKLALSGLTPNQWNELSVNLSQASTNTVNTLLDSKYAIENFFSINLINSPTLTNISILIPILTALSTYLTMKMTGAQNKQTNENDANNQAAQMEQSMKMMTTFIPGLIFITALSMPAGLGLYWMLGNLFTITQQFFFTKYIKIDSKDGAK